MEDNFVILLIILFLVALACAYVLTKKKNTSIKSNESTDNTSIAISQSKTVAIRIEALPSTSIPESTKMVEVKDKKILAKIDAIAPQLADVGRQTGKIAKAAEEHGEVLYQAIIPAGEKLAQVEGKQGMVRGFFRGEKGIKGHAEFLEKTVDNSSQIMENAVSSAMNVAAMVVGQYYMAEINAQLNTLNDGISKIADFQETEYQGKVISLLNNVQASAQFQAEIIEDKQIREHEINKLNQWEKDCSDLLGQANSAINKLTTGQTSDYKQYETQLSEIQKWYDFQGILLKILIQIADLKHTLYMGHASKEYCGATIPQHIHQCEEVSYKLNEWHNQNIEKYKINLADNNRKRFGLDAFVHIIPGWIDERKKYKALPTETAEKIGRQTEASAISQDTDVKDLYKEDVRLIAKEGKIYYLP